MHCFVHYLSQQSNFSFRFLFTTILSCLKTSTKWKRGANEISWSRHWCFFRSRDADRPLTDLHWYQVPAKHKGITNYNNALTKISFRNVGCRSRTYVTFLIAPTTIWVRIRVRVGFKYRDGQPDIQLVKYISRPEEGMWKATIVVNTSLSYFKWSSLLIWDTVL